MARCDGTSGRESNWDRYVPCAEPESDPGGAGSPRGPPPDRRRWIGDATNRQKAKAPRTAATIRGHKIQTKVNGNSVSHCVRVIKSLLTLFSRSSVGPWRCPVRRRTLIAGLRCQADSWRALLIVSYGQRARPCGAITFDRRSSCRLPRSGLRRLDLSAVDVRSDSDSRGKSKALDGSHHPRPKGGLIWLPRQYRRQPPCHQGLARGPTMNFVRAG